MENKFNNYPALLPHCSHFLNYYRSGMKTIIMMTGAATTTTTTTTIIIITTTLTTYTGVSHKPPECLPLLGAA